METKFLSNPWIANELKRKQKIISNILQEKECS